MLGKPLDKGKAGKKKEEGKQKSTVQISPNNTILTQGANTTHTHNTISSAKNKA